ncbi:MAG: arsenate reductase ArsC [Promethearchaeota archaeon]
MLFLCGSNSCRSQMSEGLVNNLWNDKFEAYSAGATTAEVHPLAIQVMKEIGIDISNQKSKLVTEFNGQDFDYVITLCAGDPGGICPLFIGNAKQTIDWNFPDPARAKGSKKEVLKVFREVRDGIQNALEELFRLS